MSFNEWVASKVESDSTRREQFVGYVDMPPEELTAQLDGLEKVEPSFGDEDWSFRCVNGDAQLHIFLYKGHPSIKKNEDKTYIFAHREPTWENLREYVFAKRDGPRGVNRVRTMLNKKGITYNDDIGIRD